MKLGWPFDQAPNVAAITTRQVIEEKLPILLVIHYSDDHSWAFLCGSTNNEEDGKIIGMETALKLNPSLLEVSKLPPGWKAYRTSVKENWNIEQI